MSASGSPAATAALTITALRTPAATAASTAVRKARFIEPGTDEPYRKSWKNRFLYNGYIRNPSTGLITLATIVKQLVEDTLMYSESISLLDMDDIYDADVVFISINTYNAPRGYQLADMVRQHRATVGQGGVRPLVVMGGMHAALNYPESVQHADYVMFGDGDESIVDVIQAMERGAGRPDSDMPFSFPGLAYLRDGGIVRTAQRPQPLNIDTIPDRSLVYDYARMAKKYDTLWGQVHASRGCTHSCDYCGVIAHFGRSIRNRSPEAVVEDIRQAIAFHERRFPPRFSRGIWITDDNFALNRDWAIAVCRAIIDAGIRYKFSVQARYELGFDDELMDLMREAGFFEVALGIEFIDDASFVRYHKRSSRAQIEAAITNFRKHGIGVRGLFILGSDDDQPGIGQRLGEFIAQNQIHGCLIQGMFFTPGTAHYEQNRHRLLHQNWNLYDGNVVHYPANMTPAELQQEIITASRVAYSPRRLLHALLHSKGILKALFVGEFIWHANSRRRLRRQLGYLRTFDPSAQPFARPQPELEPQVRPQPQTQTLGQSVKLEPQLEPQPQP